jgi:hypothetical protein
VDHHLALHRLRVPGQLELAEPVLAAHERAPLVEGEVRVAAEAAPLGVHVRDRPEQLLDHVEAVHAEVAPRVSGVAVLRRRRATLVGRVLGAPEDVDAHHLPDRAGADLRERPDHLRVVEQRVVHGRDQPLRVRHLPDAAGVLGALGDRLLHQNVAAALERLDG